MQNYPANKYCVIVWGHGYSWVASVAAGAMNWPPYSPVSSLSIKKVPGSKSIEELLYEGPGLMGFCGPDVTNQPADNLYGPEQIGVSDGELASAMQSIKTQLGRKIDLLIFMNCRMGQVEVFDEASEYSDVVVGGEGSIPNFENSARDNLQWLSANPTATAQQLGASWTDKYISYFAAGSAYSCTVNLNEDYTQLLDAINLFAQELINAGGKTRAEIIQARTNCAYLNDAADTGLIYKKETVDLYDFCEKIIAQTALPSAVRNAAQGVINAFGPCVLAEGHVSVVGTPNYIVRWQSLHGLGIFYPRTDYINTMNEYAGLHFAQNNAWYAFITGATGDSSPPNPPTNLISPNRTQASIGLSWTASTQAGDGDYASFYRVYRNSILISTAAGTSYTDSGLAAGTTYNYGIYAIDDSNNVSVSSAAGNFYTSTGSSITYTISGYVKDNSSTAISGTVVNLTGALTANTGTNATGYYQFTNLSGGGNYTVTPASAGWTISPTNKVYTSLSANQSNQNYFGSITAVTTCTISGYVKNNSSAAISAVTVYINGSSHSSVSTNASGFYQFSGLALGGSYTVTPAKTGYIISPVKKVYSLLSANQANQNFFGAVIAVTTYTISGYVKDASSIAINGIAVNLTGSLTDNTRINASGYYQFTGLAAGNYTITPSSTGWVISPANKVYTSLSANQGNQNFFGTRVCKISGYALDDLSLAISAVTMNLTGAATRAITTDGDGYYEFTGLAYGTYQLTPSKTNWTFNPANVSYSSLDSDQDQNFLGVTTELTYSISGTVRDGANAPLQGVTISLSGTAAASARSNSSGVYSFYNLSSGTYTITPFLENAVFSPVNKIYSSLNTNQLNQNFAGIVTQAYSISGYVTNDSGSGLSGLQLNLMGVSISSVVTDNSGYYIFSGLTAGNYTITPVAAEYTFDPVELLFSSLVSNLSGQSFTGTAFVSSLTPDAITDLKAQPGINAGEIKLSWTAPTINNVPGYADSYDLRYLFITVTDVDWNLAIPYFVPLAPKISGAKEILTITGLNPEKTYYFAIKAIKGSNRSLIVNTVSAKPREIFSTVLDNIKVYPNPFKPNDNKPETGDWNTGIFFYGLTNNSTINIYTVSGELVIMLEETDNDGKYQWDVKNKEKEKLSSGKYIYRITDSSGAKITGKIGVVR